MMNTLIVAGLAFALGLSFPAISRRIRKKPKGYVRIGHNGEIDIERRARRTSYSPRGDEPKPIHSKFDSLFDSDKKKDKPKVDLESVERSFTPDPKPAAVMGANELRNNYVDFSHLASESSDDNRTSFGGSFGSGSQFQPSGFGSSPSGFGESRPPTTSYGQQSPMGGGSSDNYSGSQFSGSSPFQPSQQPSGFSQPMGSQPQGGSDSFSSQPSVSEEKKDEDEESGEKEHEWKPMGFFDD